MSYLRIPKARVSITKLVDHIRYDPWGIPGTTDPRDWIYITHDRPSLHIIKQFQHGFDGLDAIVLRYLAGRRITDAVTLTDASVVQFVTAVLRYASDTVEFADRPYLLQIPATLRDSVTLNDDLIRFVRLRNLYPSDTVTADDAFLRSFSAYRVFADNVGMIDNFTLIDGGTYTINKNIREFLSVGSDIAERVSYNAAENIAFFAHKVLIDTSAAQEQIYKGLSKLLSPDLQPVEDADTLFVAKQASAEELATAEQAQYWANKTLSHGAAAIDYNELIFNFFKTLADTASMIDNLDLGDSLVYTTAKELSDSFSLGDVLTKTALKTIDQDTVSILDETLLGAIILDPFKGLNDAINITDTDARYYYLDKQLPDTVDITEVLRILRPYVFADSVVLSDQAILRPTRNKYFPTDAVTVSNLYDDRLDKFYFIKRPSDVATVTENIGNLVRFKRAPHQGFAEAIPTPDIVGRSMELTVGGGVIDNIPLLRTNLIYFSEQIGAVYWQKENVTVRSDEIPHPNLVYDQPSTTLYDPTYEAANIMELFDGYQYHNPAGRAWFREAKLTSQTQPVSAAEEIRDDAITGKHYIEAFAEADFVDFEKVAFCINLKPINRRYVRIDVANEFYAIYDLQLGIVLSTNAESAQLGRTSTDGWGLCQITARLPKFEIVDPENIFVLDVLLNYPDNPRPLRRWDLLPSARIKSVRISALEDSGLSDTYLGDGTGAFYAWGAQLELGDQVEQEISSLTYIRTVGGQQTKYGFNITPNDNDRVWVGSIHRDRHIWPTRTHNDDRERVRFLEGKGKTDSVTASDNITVVKTP